MLPPERANSKHYEVIIAQQAQKRYNKKKENLFFCQLRQPGAGLRGRKQGPKRCKTEGSVQSHASIRRSRAGDDRPLLQPYGGRGPHRLHGPEAAGRHPRRGGHRALWQFCHHGPGPRHRPRTGSRPVGPPPGRPPPAGQLCTGRGGWDEVHHPSGGAARRPP